MTAKKAMKLKECAASVYEKIQSGEGEAGLNEARLGLEVVRGLAVGLFRKDLVKIAKDAGADHDTAERIVDLAYDDRSLPSTMVTSLANKNPKLRAKNIKKSMCSVETAQWIERSTTEDSAAELMKLAQSESDPFKCFLLAACIANRADKAEFVLKAGLYAMSQAFEDDLAMYITRDKKKNDDSILCHMFGLIDKVKMGTASEIEKENFSFALADRIENALNLRPGAAFKQAKPGPDAVAILDQGVERKTVCAGYATVNNTHEKTIINATSINKHWEDIQDVSEQINLLMVFKPVVKSYSLVQRNVNSSIAKVGLEVAKLQVIGSIFNTHGEHKIVDGMLNGKVTVDGIALGSSEPFVLGKNIFEEAKTALLKIAGTGYPSETGMGNEAWKVVANTITVWATNHPESFPWFEDKKLMSWLKNSPGMVSSDTSVSSETDRALQKIKISRVEATQEKNERKALKPQFSKTRKAQKDNIDKY